MTVSVHPRPSSRAGGLLLGALAGLAALVALPALTAAPALSQEATESTGVVATVNGSPITEADIEATAVDLSAALRDYAPANHGAVVLDFLINQKLMAAAARKDGIHDTEGFAQRMELVRERELRDAYFEKAVRGSIGEEEIKQAYDKVAEEAAKREEVHASHILLETKEEAEAIVKELEGGADFAELAKEKSIGPSSESGGDLDFFGEDDVAEPFFTAASALEPGEVSEPVQTDFGWHVIKVAEKRAASAPPLEEVRGEIERILVRQKFLEVVAGLKEAAEIDIVEQPAEEGDAPQAEEAMPEGGDAGAQ